MMSKLKIKLSCWVVCFSVISLQPMPLYAEPGILSQTPLFTASGSGSNVESNIFIVVDDSGSMGGTMLAKKHWDTCLYDPAQQSGCTTTQSIGDFVGSGTDWRSKAYDLNVLSYNPNSTYVPWKKGDGTSYPDATYTLGTFVFNIAHDTHGYLGSSPSITSGGSISNKKIGTVTTTTTNSAINRTVGANGVTDFWDEYTSYTVTSTGMTKKEITYSPTITPVTGSFTCSGTTATVTPTTYATVTGCGTNNIKVTVNNTQSLNPQTSAATTITGVNEWGRTLAQELTNIANWYKYYRVRINVARGAISQVVDARPNYRYGLSFIDDLNSFVEVPPIGTTDFVPANKLLLSKLVSVPPSGYTPLPRALDIAGKYFQDGATAGKDMLNRTSPIVYECQQNFAILLTDGYWNQAFTTNANITDSDGDGVSKTLADVASYYYKTDLSPVKWANKVPTSPFDLNTKQHMVSFMVSFGLVGNLIDVDGDGWPDADPVNPGFTLSENSPAWATAPNVLSTSVVPEKIDDLWHAAFNAKGKYISAASPEEMAKAFTDILNTIAATDYKGSASAISFSSATSSNTTSTYVGQFAKPVSAAWSGDVLSFSKGSSWSAATNTESQANPVCDITTRLCETTKRKMFTSNTAGTQGVPFQWDYLTALQRADLGTDSSGLVTAGTATAPNPAAFARLAYIRGDTSQEIGKAGAIYNFRNRDQIWANATVHTNILGDIVHSDPVFVGEPTGYWPSVAPFPTGSVANNTGSYESFKNLLKTSPRLGMVYAGANDGMLHAFYAFSSAGILAGTEAMAYIPNTLFVSGNAKAGLHYLTDPSYTHRYYVDMPSVINDVFISTPSNATPHWTTILVGGEMGGGRGIFALDVTNPTLFATENTTNATKIALWEFDNSNDPDMGYSYAVPSIVMTKAVNTTTGKNRWAVVLGNGYNNTGTGKAALFVVFLDANLTDGWTGCTIGTGAGTSACTGNPDYIKIMAPVSTDPTSADITAAGTDPCDTLTTCNGLSTAQGFSNAQNSIIDRVYAGDLKGNMWAFDISQADPTSWKVAYGTTLAPKPLFTASYHIAPLPTGTPPVQGTPVEQKLCANNKACIQAITTRPVIVKNITSSVSGNVNNLILFGTGQYLIGTDPNSTNHESMYGIWDHELAIGTTTEAVPKVPLTPVNLVEQTFASGPFYDAAGTDVTSKTRVLSKNPVKLTAATNSKQGWFINLPTSKERLVVDPDVVQDKYLFFNTWIPGESTTITNGCATGGSAGGTGYLMNVDLFTGSGNPEPIVDVNSDGLINGDDLVKDTVTFASNTIMSVVGGVIYNQGLPASSTFLNQKQYTAGAKYDAAADKASAEAAAIAKAKAVQSALAADIAAKAADDAQAAYDAAKEAYDAAVASNASQAVIDAAKATMDAAKTALDAANTSDEAASKTAAEDLAAYNTADAIANANKQDSSKLYKVDSRLKRMLGGWKQILND
jgi:type IV pilus assembly protein PilY1